MQALFIGQSYIDVTFLADELPTGDEKSVARDYAVSFGGNAVTAAFCCAKLGMVPDLLATVADDWLGRMFIDMAAKYGISVHHRKVKESSLSFIMPKGGQRAIVRCRDDHFVHPFPDAQSCRIARRSMSMAISRMPPSTTPRSVARPASSPRSMAAGCGRIPTSCSEFIDVAVVAERLCEQMKLTPGEMLHYLRSRGCKIGAVTLGAHGMIWYDETGQERVMPALKVPVERVIDTNGAGDIFHGAYVYSAITSPDTPWETHFRFARAASAYAVQHLGNEASLPTLADINETQAKVCRRTFAALWQAGGRRRNQAVRYAGGREGTAARPRRPMPE